MCSSNSTPAKGLREQNNIQQSEAQLINSDPYVHAGQANAETNSSVHISAIMKL